MFLVEGIVSKARENETRRKGVTINISLSI